MRPYGFLYVFIGANASLCVVTSLNRSFVSPNAYLWVLMGPYVSLCVVMGRYGSL